MQPRLFFAATVLLSVLGGTLFLVSDTASKSDAPIQPTVRTIPLVPSPLQDHAEYSGFVRGVRQADIAPRVNGSVVKLLKEEGDVVRQGEMLAVLDGNELSASRQSALLSLEALGKTLRESKDYYDQKVDEAKTTLDHASADDRDAAEEALKSAKRFRDVQLSALATERAGLEGTALVAGAQSANLTIRAPFAGIIIRKHLSLGSFITAGSPVYTIAMPDELEVAVSLPASVAAGIVRGSSVQVINENTTVLGSVFSVAVAADETTQRATARVRFASNTAAEVLRLGSHVRVVFAVGQERSTLLVPESAVLSAYDDTFVYVVEEGMARRKPVTIGASDDEGHRAIIAGVDPGAHIVVEGQHGLIDNEPVKETYGNH